MAAKISGTSVFGETASFTTTSTDSRAKVLFNGNVTSMPQKCYQYRGNSFFEQ
ncbi:MAG: hypothetical protein ACLUKN_12585 [Bacilli bacterium]